MTTEDHQARPTNFPPGRCGPHATRWCLTCFPADRMTDTNKAGAYDEWRVTGDPGGGFPPYDFTWSPWRNPGLGDAEEGARGFVALVKAHGDSWPDGPYLQHRTVTVTDWEAAPIEALPEQLPEGTR